MGLIFTTVSLFSIVQDCKYLCCDPLGSETRRPISSSSSSTRSHRGPQRHSLMTTCGGSSPQVSWWRAVVPAQHGQSIGCWDGLGDASSFGQGGGPESDRHDTGVLGGLACLQKVRVLAELRVSHLEIPHFRRQWNDISYWKLVNATFRAQWNAELVPCSSVSLKHLLNETLISYLIQYTI